MHVRIKASKTDPFPKGAEIHIGPEVYPLCAVQAMMVYLVQRGNVPGPLLLLQDGHPLSRPHLTNWLRQIQSAVGIQGNFSSHCFHIGAVAVAVHSRVPDHLIQALGRWSSNAYHLYIHTPFEALASLSRKLTEVGAWDSKSATVGPCAAVHHCRFISHGWLRILETRLSNQKPLEPRLHLATCALSNHLESGILKHGKAPILWLLGMSVCFLCLHAAGLKIGGRTVASGELKLTRATKS